MKKHILFLLSLLLLASPARADTTTPHFSLTMPSIGNVTNWGLTTNANWSAVDSNLWAASGGLSVAVDTASSASNITLTNPLASIQNITFTTTSKNLILPAMNATASMIVGGVLTVQNAGSNAFAIVAQDGSTSIVASLAAGQTAYLVLTSGATANGAFLLFGPYITSVPSTNLGTSTSATSPSISGDATSGLYTAGAGKVDISISNAKVAEWTSAGVATTGTNTANSFIPTSSTIPSNGLYLSAANAPAIAANSLASMQFKTAASAVSYLMSTGGATGDGAYFQIGTTDSSNANFYLSPAGTGSFQVLTNSGTNVRQFQVTHTASAVDYVSVTGGVTGSPGKVTISALGSDTDINLNLVSKGAGNVQVNGVNIGDPGSSIGANGYQKFTSGLIEEWGCSTDTSTTVNITFPLAFPNNVFTVIATAKDTTNAAIPFVNSVTTSGFAWHPGNNGSHFCWEAKGN